MGGIEGAGGVRNAGKGNLTFQSETVAWGLRFEQNTEVYCLYLGARLGPRGVR